jgi:type II secretory pathway pseudopilin PulG
MTLLDPIAVVLAALITAAAGVWLAQRNKVAKRDALEKLVTSATEQVSDNYKSQIERTDREHREQVTWLQGQIKYYQEMSAPTRRQRPDHPPPPP